MAHSRHLALGAFLPGTGAQGASWRLPEADARPTPTPGVNFR